MYKFFTLKKGILNYSIEFQAVAGRDENVTNQDYIKYIPSLCEQIWLLGMKDTLGGWISDVYVHTGKGN